MTRPTISRRNMIANSPAAAHLRWLLLRLLDVTLATLIVGGIVIGIPALVEWILL